jgi:hypothetical protein
MDNMQIIELEEFLVHQSQVIVLGDRFDIACSHLACSEDG